MNTAQEPIIIGYNTSLFSETTMSSEQTQYWAVDHEGVEEDRNTHMPERDDALFCKLDVRGPTIGMGVTNVASHIQGLPPDEALGVLTRAVVMKESDWKNDGWMLGEHADKCTLHDADSRSMITAGITSSWSNFPSTVEVFVDFSSAPHTVFYVDYSDKSTPFKALFGHLTNEGVPDDMALLAQYIFYKKGHDEGFSYDRSINMKPGEIVQRMTAEVSHIFARYCQINSIPFASAKKSGSFIFDPSGDTSLEGCNSVMSSPIRRLPDLLSQMNIWHHAKTGQILFLADELRHLCGISVDDSNYDEIQTILPDKIAKFQSLPS